ncbi:MAG TPA: PEFG-CTERM sorting domain-containing protein [Nitrososphaera sp.]|nr:PEFG-CTERM sorting domain-containing protein [Nitrososphaera sp.]
MDYKTSALMAILLASVASVALVGAAYAQTTLTVETDAASYETGDDITISGQLTATTINAPILIQVLDPQGNRDRIDQIEVAADGSYSYTFRAGGLMNTDGTYTVSVSYKTTEEETTFGFDATEVEDGWRKINVNIGGTNHEIEYKISGSGNRLDSVTGDVVTISFLAELTAASDGTLSLRFSEDIFDAEDVFVAFVDEIPYDDDLPAGPGATNEINIDFEAGTEQIEIVGDFIIPEFGAIAAIILAVAIVGVIVATARYGKFNFAPRL